MATPQSSGELTVEQLAYETGMSVRNIRNHQSRGLLPPPDVRARIGYYGTQHVERLRLIQEMQAEGFKLTAIQRILGEQGGAAERFIGLRRAITAPFETEAPEILEAEELVERFGADPRLRAKAEKLGFLVPLGDGRFEAPSPSLLHAAEEVLRLGIAPATALELLAKVRRNSQSTARTFVGLFLDEIWKPFDAAGQPQEQWPEITEAIERLRPLAAEALLAIFKQTMADAVEDAFGRMLEQQARSPRSSR
ncbi:MAG: MerR family transcriptional regulator [Solirubrobacterales bacterium]|nr:MerR family transcriptional regulator [Solirubrobacterales bacterium]